MRRQVVAAMMTAGVLGGCATSGMPSLGGARSAPAAIAGETFSFNDARNPDIAVSVRSTAVAGHDDFLPGDPNWIQVDLVIENIGSDTIAFSEVQERLQDGRTIRSASSVADLMKAPSYVASTATNIGIGTAGMVAGTLLFPPAAILGGLAMVFMPMLDADRLQNRMAEFDRRALHVGPVAPGSYVSGLVFLPAVTGLTGITVTYSRNGAVRSIYLSRNSTAFTSRPEPVAAAVPPMGNPSTLRVRTTATLRSQPSATAQALTVLRTPATVIDTGERNGDWWQVRDQSGTTGWVFGTLLAPN